MRRVVVTGMGIVSSIGNNTQEVLASLARARIRHHARRNTPRSASAARCRARRRSIRPTCIDRRAMRFWARARPGITSPWSRRSRDAGLTPEDVSNVAHRHHHGLRRAVRRAPSSRPPTSPREQGPQARRSVRGAEGDVLDRLGDARDLVQDQGRELFDHLGLRDLATIASATPTSTIQIGKQDIDVRRRLRGARLDAVGAVRRHGRDVHEVQRHALRPPRAPTTQTATASSSPAAPACVVLEELEHAKARGAKIYAEIVGYGATSDGYDMVAPSGEGAARCMRMALETVKTPDRLHQPARHLDADRRCQGDRGDPRGVRPGESARRSRPPSRSPATRSARPACRRRSIRILMMQQRLRLRERQHRPSSIPAFADMPIVRKRIDNVDARHGAVQLLRLRRHQRHAGVQADGCVISLFATLRLR